MYGAYANRSEERHRCVKTGLTCEYKTVARPSVRHRGSGVGGNKRQKRSLDDTSSQPPSGNNAHTLSTDPSTSTSTIPVSKKWRTSPKLPSPAQTPETARLVPEGGGFRYVNNHLWNSLPTGATVPHGNVTTGSASTTYPASNSVPTTLGSGDGRTQDARSFVFPFGDSAQVISHPSAGDIVSLWQVYLSNVDPIMKVLHAPSVQQLMLGQIGKSSLPANEQALVSAIYLSSVVSLDDEECRKLLREPRDEAVSKFRHDTESALSAAGFVCTTDVMILQAFVLYLAAVRSQGEAQQVWAMTGLCIRVAGSMGLLRDGSVLSLSPFETELRRRLWWAIVYMDARTSELVGQESDLLVQAHDVQMPSNVNDSDLFPSMQRLPEIRPAATEMVYVQLRATISSIMRQIPGIRGPGGLWKKMAAADVPHAEKADIVRKLEAKFEEDIMRYYDPGVPLQLLSMNSARTVLAKLRLVASGPSTLTHHGGTVSERFSSAAFEESTRLMQLQLDLWERPCLKRFLWHSRSHFQWHAFATLIRQTRLREHDQTTMKAWAIIQRVLNIIFPTLELGPKKSPLLESVRALLNAASTGPPAAPTEPHKVVDSRHPSVSVANLAQPSLKRETTPPAPVLHGARPHSALLPPIYDPNFAPIDEATQIQWGLMDDSMLDFRLDTIDWAEFDRLAAELCQQGYG